MDTERRLAVVAGHYGSGKTNFAVNLALRLAAECAPEVEDKISGAALSEVWPCGCAQQETLQHEKSTAACPGDGGGTEPARWEKGSAAGTGTKPPGPEAAHSPGEVGVGGVEKRAGHRGSWADRFGLMAASSPVTLVDLDIVNPYFRAADAGELLADAGVRLIAPRYAGSNLDIPALPPEVGQVFAGRGRAVFDVGGDDAGATPLGRYAAEFERAGYVFLFCVNFRRMETRTPEEACALLREIETASRLRATAIVNNTNLGPETTPALVRESEPLCERLAALAELPVAGVTALPEVAGAIPGALPVERYIGNCF